MPALGVVSAPPAAAGTSSPDPTSISLFLIPQRPETPGEGFGVWGTVTDPADPGDAVAGAVAILATYPGSASPVLLATTSVSQFDLGVTLPPAATATYVAQFGGAPATASTPAHAAATSAPVVGTVTGQVVATGDKTRVKDDHAVRIDVDQLPAQPGTPVVLQEFRNKRWTTIATAAVNGAGHAHFWVKPRKPGRHLYRVIWKGDAVAGGNSSGTIVITAT
jgi:hypothetical protein